MEKITKDVSVKEASAPTQEEIYRAELNKISGKFIIKNNRTTWLSTMAGNSDGRVLHVGTFTMYTPELSPFNRGAVITGITSPLLREALAWALNTDPKDFHENNRAYWGNYFIKIPAEGLILDCDVNAKNKLDYLILKASSRIYSDGINGCKDKARADYIITSTEAEKSKEAKSLELLTAAYSKLGSMTLSERMDFLKVYEEGKFKVSNNSKPDFINANMKQVIEDSPTKFLEVFNNPFYKEAVFLQDCLMAKLVEKVGPKYYVKGGEKLGDSYISTLQNLQSDDWQSVKISLLGKLQRK